MTTNTFHPRPRFRAGDLVKTKTWLHYFLPSEHDFRLVSGATINVKTVFIDRSIYVLITKPETTENNIDEYAGLNMSEAISKEPKNFSWFEGYILDTNRKGFFVQGEAIGGNFDVEFELVTGP